MRTTLLAAASALVLSAGVASAAPAVTESAVHMRAGPGTQFQIVTTLPDGARVDAGPCNGGWCAVAWNGESGYVSQNYLQMAGNPGVIASGPDYYYDDEPDYGAGIYVTPGFYGPGYRYRHGHHGNWNRGHTWNPGPGRPGHPPVIGRPGRPGGPGFAGPPANWRGNPGIGTPRVSAPTGLRSGRPAAPAAPAAGPRQGSRTPLAR